MAGRTIAIGDIHGDLKHLFRLLSKLPELDAQDTIVLLGDYIDRGPQSAQVVDYVRRDLPAHTAARLVTLRGNHEDAWLRVASGGWPEFIGPHGNGCLSCYRSFIGGPVPAPDEIATKEEYDAMCLGEFIPEEVIAWFNTLLYWYEDEHAIYVHAGIPPREDGSWPHPRDVENQIVLLWIRTEAFFTKYNGKLVVCGHTTTDQLPPDLSSYTPDDPTDLWAGEHVVVLDTGCGKGGFLTALELPSGRVYESRD